MRGYLRAKYVNGNRTNIMARVPRSAPSTHRGCRARSSCRRTRSSSLHPALPEQSAQHMPTPRHYNTRFRPVAHRRLPCRSNVAAHLAQIAKSFHVAVVCINQMTTKYVGEGSGGSGSHLVPALGESFAHATTTRLVLSRSPSTNDRVCKLVKSPHLPTGQAKFAILEKGIRDPNAERAKRSRAD